MGVSEQFYIRTGTCSGLQASSIFHVHIKQEFIWPQLALIHLCFALFLICLNVALEETHLESHGELFSEETHLENHGELFLGEKRLENHGEFFLAEMRPESRDGSF